MTLDSRRTRYFKYIAPVIKTPLVKTYGSLILSIFSLIIFIVFAIKPTIETILVLQKDSSQQKDVLEKITQKGKNLDQAIRNYAAIDNDTKARIQKAIPTQSDLGILAKSLEDISLRNQASISALQFQPLTIEEASASASTDKQVKEILFTYNLESKFDNLMVALQELRNNTRIITIDSLAFNKAAGSQILLMSVTGKAYYLR